MSELIIEKPNNDLTLTIPENDFAKIILDFLGSKETISKKINAPFSIDLEGLKQFHYLLMQKVEKERFTDINIFSGKIRYEGGVERSLTSFDGLNSFFEQKSVNPTSVSLAWSIVLGFANAKTIETQKISLTLGKDIDKDTGTILVDIEHTNQSWGFEVFTLFESQIDRCLFFKPRRLRFYESINKYGIPSKLFGMLILSVTLFVSYEYLIDMENKNSAHLLDNTETVNSLKDSLKQKKLMNHDNEKAYFVSEIWNSYNSGRISESVREEAIDRALVLGIYQRTIFLGNSMHASNSEIDIIVKKIDENSVEFSKAEGELIAIEDEYSLGKVSNWKNLMWGLVVALLKVCLILPVYLLFDKYVKYFLTEKTFILITDKEVADKERYLKNKSSGVLAVTVGFTLSIIAGIVTTAVQGLVF